MSTIETDELKPWWIKLKEALEQKNEDNYCKVDATDLEFSIEDYQRIHQQLQKAREEGRQSLLDELAEEQKKFTQGFAYRPTKD